jgi:hypothetical protein
MQSDRAVLNLWKCFYLTGQEKRKWAVLAVIAWCVRGCSHVISLVLIFNVAMKDGLLHAVYSKHYVTQSVVKKMNSSLCWSCLGPFYLKGSMPQLEVGNGRDCNYLPVSNVFLIEEFVKSVLLEPH